MTTVVIRDLLRELRNEDIRHYGEVTRILGLLDEAAKPVAADKVPVLKSVPYSQLTEAEQLQARVSANARDIAADEAIASAFFEMREPGTVTEAEYRSKLADIRDARNYLRNEECWRVELSERYGPMEAVNWIEARNADEARGGFARLAAQNGIKIVSVVRATESDLEEYLEGMER